MFVITCKRSHDVASYMEMGLRDREIYVFLAADRFRRIDKHNNKIRQIIFVVIVVDETLVKIDGLEYWLWVGRLRA
jgi:hypothetical protein